MRNKHISVNVAYVQPFSKNQKNNPISYKNLEKNQISKNIKNLINISFINSWCCLENVLVHSWRKQFQEISSKILKNLVSTKKLDSHKLN